MAEDRSDSGFYIGYSSLPRRHRVFLVVAVPLAIAGMLVGALGLAMAQPAWGDGFWETGDAREFRGTLSLEPYPMLHVEGAGVGDSYLLVEMGKFGAGDRFADLEGIDGATVAIRGRELRRDGRRMIEIDPGSGEGDDPVSVLPSDKPAVRIRSAVDEGGDVVTIAGEIVDSKCYLGAMKPGAGRGHKACATLCVSGGIPPVLVVRDGEAGEGAVSYLLLTDAAGRGLRGSGLEAIEPMIAEGIEVRGRLGRAGSWRTLRLEPGQFD